MGKIKNWIKGWIGFILTWRNDCEKCKAKNSLGYAGDDYIGTVWISVYKCRKCKTKYV